jgi:hypothetical protein
MPCSRRMQVVWESNSSAETSVVARLNTNGTLDSTFGNGGLSALVPGFNAFAIAVQPNNQIILVSGGGELARIQAQ